MERPSKTKRETIIKYWYDSDNCPDANDEEPRIVISKVTVEGQDEDGNILCFDDLGDSLDVEADQLHDTPEEAAKDAEEDVVFAMEQVERYIKDNEKALEETKLDIADDNKRLDILKGLMKEHGFKRS